MIRDSIYLVAALSAVASFGCGDVVVADGDGKLVSVIPEDAGENCPDGGFKISLGSDLNNDAILDEEEVEQTSFVCNGAGGEQGGEGLGSLVDLKTEPPGDNCFVGGTRIESGVDSNEDGVLDPSEITDTGFACDAPRLLPTLVNGSFETADFLGWETQDLTSPLTPLSVSATGASDGVNGVQTGFDGDGAPGNNRIFVAQDVDLTNVGPTAISFDWEIPSCSPTGGMLDRIFSLEIEPAGGGMPFLSETVFTCIAGENTSNPLVDDQVIDISAVSDQPVRIKFQWLVPENFTGPASARLDDIKLVRP